MEVKSGKMELSLSFYYIFIYKYFFKVSSNKCFTSEIGYIFGQILFNPPPPPTFAAHLKKRLCSCLFKGLRSLSVTYLITLSLEKETVVLQKSLESVWKVTFSLPSPLSMLKLHLLPEQECAPLIRSRCYNIQMWLPINFILMEFGLFCLLIISRLMSCAIFNFSFQIRCPRMYQELTLWEAQI